MTTELTRSAALEITSLTKSYGETVVLHGVDLTVNHGEVAAIVGASGGGKSTMLYCINNLELPDSGTIKKDGVPVGRWRDADGKAVTQRASDLHRARAAMPMVFQRFNLFDNLTVLGNVVVAQRKVLRRSKKEAHERALVALDKVHMAEKRDAYPRELSGGQAQRIGIARALAMDPSLMLLDEPTSSLDPSLVGEVVDVICELASEGMTMVVVTHEMSVARSVASKVHLMARGKIVESATPERFFGDPDHPQTKAFVEALNRRAHG